jgi:hypothetical protein
LPAEHRLLKFLLPGSIFEALRCGTRNYLLECPCGHKQDLWDSGGVKGKGTTEFTYGKCPVCNKWRWHKKRRKSPDEVVELVRSNPAWQRDGQIFISKHDWWATSLVWGVAILISGSCIIAAGAVDSQALRWFWSFASLLLAFVPLWFWFTTYYKLTDKSLLLQSGPFQKRLSLHGIKQVDYPSRGIGISFAFSQDTLSIFMSESSFKYLVSPRDRQGFLKALAKQCPHLRLTSRGLFQQN